MSDDLPQYSPCEVTLEFGDGEYLFRLPLKCIAELQDRCKAGVGTIYARICSGNHYAEDLIETVRLGLIGGGLSGPGARKLIDRYCDTWPLEVWHTHACAVLAACIHGYQPPEDEKKTSAETDQPPSASSKPTETEPH